VPLNGEDGIPVAGDYDGFAGVRQNVHFHIPPIEIGSEFHGYGLISDL
jgi:hypothetical protein